MNGDNINVDVYIDVDDDVVIVRILVVGDDDEPGASRGVEVIQGPRRASNACFQTFLQYATL